MKRLTKEQLIERLNKEEKDFRHLDLSRLDLGGLDLSNCDLSYADLCFSNLCYANLEGANLYNADLCFSNLCYANLENAILSYSYLSNADLSRAKLNKKEEIRKGMILKESMIGYKKCRSDTIVTLEIPKGAVVFSINNNKCRTNRAKVLEISDGKKVAFSSYNISFAYKLGEEIEIEDFDLRYNIEYSTGIHFFKTREEAEKY